MKIEAKSFSVGAIFSVLCLAGCATAFPWHYYATQMPEACYDQGTLLGKLGKDGWPDEKLNQCKPDAEPSPGASPTAPPKKLKCITMPDGDFYDLKADDEKCHKDLQICQGGSAP